MNLPPPATEEESQRYVTPRHSNPLSIPKGNTTLEGMVTAESSWCFFTPAETDSCASGMLDRRGDITLLNPDKNSPTSAIHLQYDVTLHLMRGKFEIDKANIKICAIPRQATASYCDEVRGSVPHASFVLNPSRYSPRDNIGYNHGSWLTEALTGKKIEKPDVWGTDILHVTTNEGVNSLALKELKNSSLFSTDIRTREAIVETIESLLKGMTRDVLPDGKLLPPANSLSK